MTARSLHPQAADALEAIYQHRLLATRQLRELVAPSNHLRWVQRLLAALARLGLVEAIPSHRRGSGRTELLWFLTTEGAEVVEAAPNRTETRRRLLTPALAAGQLQTHTLAVNDAGIAFLRAARELGHDFDPLSWRHEVGHPLSRRTRSPELLVPDAVLRYWVAVPGSSALHYRFLELDRATLQVDDLAAKLARYADLYRFWTDLKESGLDQPAWPAPYRAFPNVLVILANPERANLQRRLRTVLALCRSDLGLQRCQGLSISFALFADLMERGPFAPIFRRPWDDGLVDWLGRPSGRETRRSA